MANVGGDVFVTGDCKGTIHQIRVETVDFSLSHGESVKALKCVEGKIVALCGNGEGAESTLLIYSLPLSEASVPEREIKVPEDTVHLAVTSDKIFTSTSTNVAVWDTDLESLCDFKPHDPSESISCLHAIEPDMAMRSDDSDETCVVTGTNKGSLLQHQILKTPNGYAHWPLMKNQRMKRKAHTFKTSEFPIVDIKGDWSKIISVDEDGTVRFFSANKGGKNCHNGIGSKALTTLTTFSSQGIVCILWMGWMSAVAWI